MPILRIAGNGSLIASSDVVGMGMFIVKSGSSIIRWCTKRFLCHNDCHPIPTSIRFTRRARVLESCVSKANPSISRAGEGKRSRLSVSTCICPPKACSRFSVNDSLTHSVSDKTVSVKTAIPTTKNPQITPLQTIQGSQEGAGAILNFFIMIVWFSC